MHEGRNTGIERLLARTARALSGGGLHPLEIVQQVEIVATGSVRDGIVANQLTVALHPDDYARYRGAQAELREVLDEMLDRLERDNGYRRVGDRLVSFAASQRVNPGEVAVSSAFTDTTHREAVAPGAAPRPAQTKRITRHRGWALVIGDGMRVALTHTPFTIGRAPGNDLVLVRMAVSRHHAQVESSSDGGFVVRDLGSRNGLMVEGARVGVAALNSTRPVEIGDVPVWLEQAP